MRLKADRAIAKRSLRAAVVVPGTFALSRVVGESMSPASASQLELLAAFGSIALLLLVEFAGPPRQRLRAYLTLMVVGSVLIVVGTLCSNVPALAALSMGLVAFAILFAGVTSRLVAAATVATLLTYVLPVAVQAPSAEIGPRLLGWVLAGALAIPVTLLIWPPPSRDPIRQRLAEALQALARLARLPGGRQAEPALAADVRGTVDSLIKAFDATTFRPTSGSSNDVAIPKLFGRIQWAANNALLEKQEEARMDLPPIRRTNQASAAVLETSAEVLMADQQEVPELAERLGGAVSELEETRQANQATALRQLLHPRGDSPTAEPTTRDERILSVLDPSFHSRAFGWSAELIGEASAEAANMTLAPGGASRTSARERSRRAWRTAVRRARSHLSFESVWLRNSIRGAVGLALAVGVVELTDLQHGFWIVLGTLSVLRSNAVGTTASAFQAVAGTFIGFVVGALLLLALGTSHVEALWAFLPVGVFLAAYAPQAISFIAGQAAFTFVILVLFNILSPVGVSVGFTRIENVAIGAGVSLIAGLLLWPRGAAAAVGRALCEAYRAAGVYLQFAVERVSSPYTPTEETELAQLFSDPAFDRLDDAFRQYLWERGTRPVAIESVSELASGAMRTRLAAHALAQLTIVGNRRHRTLSDPAEAAGAALEERCRSVNAWYEELGTVLYGQARRPPPVPTADGKVTQSALALLDDARARRDVVELRTALRILWADEALDLEEKLQGELATSAVVFAERPRLESPVTWFRFRPQPVAART